MPVRLLRQAQMRRFNLFQNFFPLKVLSEFQMRHFNFNVVPFSNGAAFWSVLPHDRAALGAVVHLSVQLSCSAPCLSWPGNMCHGERACGVQDPADSRSVPMLLRGKIVGRYKRACHCQQQAAVFWFFFFPSWTIMHTVNFWVTGWQPSRSNNFPSTGIS